MTGVVLNDDSGRRVRELLFRHWTSGPRNRWCDFVYRANGRDRPVRVGGRSSGLMDDDDWEDFVAALDEAAEDGDDLEEVVEDFFGADQ